MAPEKGKTRGGALTHDGKSNDEMCQCINCRLARMEKQLAQMRTDFEIFKNDG